jgi:hypothetical protein
MGVKARRYSKSASFLSPQKRSDFPDWDKKNNKYDRTKDIMGIANKAMLAGKPDESGKTYSVISVGELRIREYVKNVFPNTDYLSIPVSCILYETPENVRLRFSRDDDVRKLYDNLTIEYEIKIPYSFMLRMGTYMKVNYEGKDLWSKIKKH